MTTSAETGTVLITGPTRSRRGARRSRLQSVAGTGEPRPPVGAGAWTMKSLGRISTSEQTPATSASNPVISSSSLRALA